MDSQEYTPDIHNSLTDLSNVHRYDSHYNFQETVFAVFSNRNFYSIKNILS